VKDDPLLRASGNWRENEFLPCFTKLPENKDFTVFPALGFSVKIHKNRKNRSCLEKIPHLDHHINLIFWLFQDRFYSGTRSEGCFTPRMYVKNRNQ
jgi:hypothetical protein